MGWAAATSPDTGLVQTGTTRAFWLTGQRAPALGDIILQCATFEDQIRVLVPASADGRSGWECGIMGDAGCVNTDLSIRRVRFASPDAPVAGAVAHGLVTGEPFTLTVRIVGDTITATITTSTTTVTVVYVNTVDPTFATYTEFGYVSEVDGARILSATLAPLTQSTESAKDVLVATANGDVHISIDGAALELLGRRELGTGPIGFAQYLSTGYMVGGGKAKILNVLSRAITNWVPTAGALPGATTTGTCDCSIVVRWGARVVLAASSGTPQVVTFSALDDPLDLDTGSAEYGAAFAITFDEPVTALIPVSDSLLLICSARSVWAMLGDPGSGASNIEEIAGATGASGQRATLAKDMPGGPMVHSADGLETVLTGGAQSLSGNIQTEGINLDRTATAGYTVSLVRDTTNRRVWLFLTPTTGTALHFCLDEDAGAFFPIEFADSDIDPTAAIYYRGQLLIGGKDGVIRRVDEAIGDDDGVAFTQRLPFNIIDDGAVEGDMIVSRVSPMLSETSGTVYVTCYGADTPQRVTSPSQRSMLWRRQWSMNGPPIMAGARDPSLLIELSGVNSAAWGVEQVDVTIDRMATTSRRRRSVSSIGVPCPSPTAPVVTPPIDGGTGPGAPPTSSGGVSVGDDMAATGPTNDFPGPFEASLYGDFYGTEGDPWGGGGYFNSKEGGVEGIAPNYSNGNTFGFDEGLVTIIGTPIPGSTPTPPVED